MKSFYIPNIIEVGIDEAGRGPLFGRVYVGACILPPDCTTDLIRDSKKLSARKRWKQRSATEKSKGVSTSIRLDLLLVDDSFSLETKLSSYLLHMAFANICAASLHMLWTMSETGKPRLE